MIGIFTNDHAFDKHSDRAKRIDEAQNIKIVGDTNIAAHLVLFDIVGTDGNDDLCAVAKREQHFDLRVGRKAGKHARCVEVVKQLAAKLQIQLIAKLLNALCDMLRLHMDIFFVVKTNS